jgi:hypothetical protein
MTTKTTILITVFLSLTATSPTPKTDLTPIIAGCVAGGVILILIIVIVILVIKNRQKKRLQSVSHNDNEKPQNGENLLN